ncbi:alpha/beta fold hydrolase [Inhella sp.]|uniref:alpha/beta fold hydrolase n=1 Tax=Inhella sp. TaxID=1921806 RepID=UPI0035AF78F9
MSPPRLCHYQAMNPGGLHRLAYWEWGDATNPRVLVCAHGLTRQGRDFDTLAQRLSGEYRVVCPDVVGRGESDWLPEPEHYGLPQYVSDMVALLARLDAGSVDWVGTSMGGLIGLVLAAVPGNPLRRLVLNDVGPTLEAESLQRIGTYVGQRMHFASFEEGVAYLRSISAGFGQFPPGAWEALSRPMFKPTPQGLRLHYDPGIGLAFRSLTPEAIAESELFLWAAYESLQLPVLLLRGAESDLLSPQTAQRMADCGPRAQVLELPEVGHAPMLDRDSHLNPVIEFLRAA